MLFVNYKKKSREETCMFSHGTPTAHTTPRLSLTSGTRTKTTIYETSINPWRMALNLILKIILSNCAINDEKNNFTPHASAFPVDAVVVVVVVVVVVASVVVCFALG